MAYPASFTDARGATITLDQPPRRIVSLVPSQTELLADLGLEDEVAGLTRFCVHPSDWKQRKVIVGGTKQVNAERIRDLEPDLILANLEENTREMIEVLDGLAPVYVTDVKTVADALAMIRTVGRMTNRLAEAEALAAAIDEAFAALPAFAPVRAAYLIWQDPTMTVGHDTFIHDVMARAGLVNVFGTRTRYPEISDETLVAAQPDVILLSSEPYPFKEKHKAYFRTLLPDAAVHLVDGALCSWYGSRLRHTPTYLHRLRYRLRR
jgi:ABC-type Fe3+-hydroxamate transport system substrate-binding protein